jgi:hypothetical protein
VVVPSQLPPSTLVYWISYTGYVSMLDISGCYIWYISFLETTDWYMIAYTGHVTMLDTSGCNIIACIWLFCWIQLIFTSQLTQAMLTCWIHLALPSELAQIILVMLDISSCYIRACTRYIIMLITSGCYIITCPEYVSNVGYIWLLHPSLHQVH